MGIHREAADRRTARCGRIFGNQWQGSWQTFYRRFGCAAGGVLTYGPARYLGWACSFGLVCLSRLECLAARAGCGSRCRRVRQRAATRHWTQVFMASAARFLAQFFPIFLLGAVFGKLMDDSRSVSAVADLMTKSLGERRAILSVVLAGAFVTYGGVSLFVAFFVLSPTAQALFRAAAVPRRLMPAAIVLGTSTFTMSALPGTPSIQNAIPMPFFGTTPFAAPGLGIIAAAIMLGFGLWLLAPAEAAARRTGEGYGSEALVTVDKAADDE